VKREVVEMKKEIIVEVKIENNNSTLISTISNDVAPLRNQVEVKSEEIEMKKE
jgi:hypothetical protein